MTEANHLYDDIENDAKVSGEINMSDLVTQKATSEDLNDILAFLKQEYDEKKTELGFGEFCGFWCHRELIEKGQKENNLSVLVRPSDAMVLAFCLWSIDLPSMDIMEVRPELQRKGFGRHLAKHVLEALDAEDFIGIEIECAPKTSLGFWQKMGFQEIKKQGRDSRTRAAYLFHKTREVPNDAETRTVDIHLEENGCLPMRSFHCLGIVEGMKCTLEKDFIACRLLLSRDAPCDLWGDYYIHICVEGYPEYRDCVKYCYEVGMDQRYPFVRLRELDLLQLIRQ